MFKSKYIIIVAVAMSLLGFVSQKQTHTPNQEIVIQFNSVKLLDNHVQTAISCLKNRLKDAGADNIKLIKSQKGKLKITYYSSLDVALVKQIFSKDQNLNLSFNIQNQHKKSEQVPYNDENTSDYKFQIHEIQKDHASNNGLKGVLFVGFDSKIYPYFNSNSIFYSEINDLKILDNTTKLSILIYNNPSVVLHNISKNNPEVRAGPIS